MPLPFLSHNKRPGRISLKTAFFLSGSYLALLCAVFLSWYTCGSPSARFTFAANRLFREEMTASTLNMHYTIAFPEEYGIKDYQPLLPGYNHENHQKSCSDLTKQLALLRSIPEEELSLTDAYTLKLLISYLDTSLELAKYPYHEEPLSPSFGMQSQLPILLAEYAFRTPRDVEDYLALLSQTGTYFDSLLAFEKDKKEAGLLSAASSLRKTADQCRTIITREELEQGTHFLQLTFQQRLEELFPPDSVSSDKITFYIQRNNQILEEILLPAYQRLAEGLTLLADPGITLSGLAAKPLGAAYYECLLQRETGSYRSVQEIKQLLTRSLQEEYNTLCTVIKDTDPAYLSEDARDACFEMLPFESSGHMMSDLKERFADLFPDFPDNGQPAPTVRIKEVNPCLQPYCAPAFYLTPPVDDTLCNSIYINPRSTISTLDLYTTLAHEGYPGHMYQTVYSNRLLSEQKNSPVRQLLWYGGYLEGWALYVEFLAYDQAANIMQELGQPEYANLLKTEKHNRATQLCLYSLLDILIHHENMDLGQTAEFLAEFGITNSASVSAIYEYIAEEPANYPKYYLGYLEILHLRNTCEKVWEDKFSDYAFHKFFLDNGPADFKTLRDLAESYDPPAP